MKKLLEIKQPDHMGTDVYIAIRYHDAEPANLAWAQIGYSKTPVGLTTREYNTAMARIGKLAAKVGVSIPLEVRSTDSVGVFTNAANDKECG